MSKTKTKRHAKKTPMQKQRAARKATEESNAKKFGGKHLPNEELKRKREPTNKPPKPTLSDSQIREAQLEGNVEEVLDKLDELGGTSTMTLPEFIEFLGSLKESIELRLTCAKQDLARETQQELDRERE